MEEVQHIQAYIERMEKSCLDKMFFLDKFYDPVHTILDFGCANGVLIQAMSAFYPGCRYVGYDISPQMLEKARQLVPDAEFYQNWEDIRIDPKETLLNISSTVHEVYSYGDEASISEFWERVFRSGFRYIAIRDMMVSGNLEDRVDPADLQKARQLYPEKLSQYESIWGSIDHRHNFIHYLLKYRYTENWEREVRENYLPLPVEDLLSMIPEDYEVIYIEHYVLPYIRQHIRRDCGIDLKDPTHFKILLRKCEKKEG